MMGETNKILTVSYGTFSCTLEGFDDSFEMMKAIAEYFRGLAAEDRFFGATPPTPDPALLAGIAERESARRVAAQEKDGHIVLRASDDAPERPAPQVDTAAQAPAAAPPVTVAPVAAATVAEAPIEAVKTAPSPVEAPAPTAAPEPIVAAQAVAGGSIAERLQRIRAVVNGAEANPQLSYEDEDGLLGASIDATEDEVVASEPADETVSASDAIDTDTALDAPAQPEDTDPELETAIEAETDLIEDDAALAPEAEPTPSADAIAQAEVEPEPPLETVAPVAEDTSEFLDPFEVDELVPSRPRQRTMSARLKDALTELAVEDSATEAEVAETSAEDTIASVLSEMEDTANVPAESIETDETVAAEPETQASDDDVPDEEPAADNLFGETQDQPSEQADAPTAETPRPRRRARVIKVKRADLRRAVDEGKLEEAPEAPAAPEQQPVATTDTSLSPQEEADLMAELAKVHADPEDAPDDTTASGQAGTDEIIAREAAEATAELEAMDLAEEASEDDPQEQPERFATDVNRLMDKADAHMEEPETAKRRSAFQALKAAVAARKADRGLADEANQNNDSVAYRSDLAEVVQPRRPEPAPKAETSELRPAPLRLVAEQRVDVAATAQTEEPVRPRRVSGNAPAAPASEDGAGFVSYARDKGATELPDVLEAAAAYLAFVEGKEQFSRPQLMTKVRQVENEDFSREDGLRAFGQLLRAGKIEKVAGGRFSATNEIGYRPDQRAVG